MSLLTFFFLIFSPIMLSPSLSIPCDRPYQNPYPHPMTPNLPPQPTFCARTVVRNSCPDPPTADGLMIAPYMGTWYQIASTARYKLSSESGLVCEQANYTLLSNIRGTARMAAVNSGAAVISRPEAAAISRLSQSTNGICSTARSICSAVRPRYSRLFQNLRQLDHAADFLAYSHPPVAADLRQHGRQAYHLARFVESDVDALAANVSSIQQALARISQDEAPREENLRQLTEVVLASLAAVRGAGFRIASGDYIRREVLRVAATLAGENPSLALQTGRAAYQIAAEFARVESYLADVGAQLAHLARSVALFRGLREPSTVSRAPPVTYGLGFQNWSSPGRLEMDFYGNLSPYWVIGLEGSAMEGYRAAMVYWCREDLNGEIYDDLFVLSRSKQLEESILDRFVRMAEAYGIYTDCDNPLVLTEQRGGSCGAP